jgi:hypothetical protein
MVRPDGTPALVDTPSVLLATKGFVVGGLTYSLRILPSG